MVPTILALEVHPVPTHRGRLLYQFTPKHHGGDAGAATWRAELTREEEFEVIDTADQHEIADTDGNLYGLLRGEGGTLRALGTWDQRPAEFPVARPGEPWHGYPIFPVNDEAPENRQGFACKPAKEVFGRLLGAGLVDRREKKRLAKGDFV